MIDKVQWDDCISQAVNGNLNATSWYLDIVSPGWCALVEDDYQRVFPLPVESKGGFRYIRQPFFTQQLGLFYRTFSDEKYIPEFIAAIPSTYKLIDYNLNTSNRISPSEHVSDLVNIELELFNDYKTIASKYQNNLQRNLRKAVLNGFRLEKQVPIDDIINLFRANKGLELTHLSDSQYNLMRQIAETSIQKGIGEIWGAYDKNNELIAGILWVTSHQKSIFLFSALSHSGKKLHAMPWLIDCFIQQNAGKGLTLDFEGSNNPGLARFYSSFGSKTVVYQRYFRNSLPFIFRVALNMWRNIRKFIKKV
jgi:hypothetical protein